MTRLDVSIFLLFIIVALVFTDKKNCLPMRSSVVMKYSHFMNFTISYCV